MYTMAIPTTVQTHPWIPDWEAQSIFMRHRLQHYWCRPFPNQQHNKIYNTSMYFKPITKKKVSYMQNDQTVEAVN